MFINGILSAYGYKVLIDFNFCFQWFLAGPCRRDQRGLTGDLVCFVVLTPLAVFSVYMCLNAALIYLHQLPQAATTGSRKGEWEAVALIFLSSFLILVYGIWFGLTLAFQLRAYKEWKANNQEIRLATFDATNRQMSTLQEEGKQPQG